MPTCPIRWIALAALLATPAEAVLIVKVADFTECRQMCLNADAPPSYRVTLKRPIIVGDVFPCPEPGLGCFSSYYVSTSQDGRESRVHEAEFVPEPVGALIVGLAVLAGLHRRRTEPCPTKRP